jgi:hypothetical protein
MGNKGFSKDNFKTQVAETRSRLTVKRSKKVNEVHKQKKKMADSVRSGDVQSALIYCDTVIYEEGLLQVFDVLATMCDQLKGKANEIDSYGVTEDLKN